MISTRSSKDLGSPPNAHPPFARRLLQHPVRHLRGLARLVTRRHLAAFAVSAASTAAIAGTATAVSIHCLHTAQVQPLAPAPGPLSSRAAVAAAPAHPQKHRLLATLAAHNPLRGIASWYGSVLHGHHTASGEIFDESLMTACHRTLPFGTLVRVTDESSARSVVVRINDRGVLNPDRVIDLSAAAADRLGILRSGVARVRLEVLKAAPPARPAEDLESN